MSEIKNSDFLVALLKRARNVMIENHGKVLSENTFAGQCAHHYILNQFIITYITY